MYSDEEGIAEYQIVNLNTPFAQKAYQLLKNVIHGKRVAEICNQANDTEFIRGLSIREACLLKEI